MVFCLYFNTFALRNLKTIFLKNRYNNLVR